MNDRTSGLVVGRSACIFLQRSVLAQKLPAQIVVTDCNAETMVDCKVGRATRTLLESGLAPAEVMDLIPVKPLAEMEPGVAELYRTRLPAVYQKIKP